MNEKQMIFFSAGDPSADFPGKLLIEKIRQECPDIEVHGLGGPLMQQAGLRPLADYQQLAILGFWEIVPKYFYFRRLMNKMVASIESYRPKAVILLDYPGFNLSLARRIRHLNIPVIYFISPQVWAWGGGRVRLIKELVDLMLVIFPFEVEFYRKHNIKAHFVGHPIVDRFAKIADRQSCRELLEIAPDEKLIALLPGSRPQEVRRMLPAMVTASGFIGSQIQKTRFIIAAIDNIEERLYRDSAGKEKVEIVTGQTPELINASDFVITSSGTATLEVAYFSRPMVVIYKTGLLTYQIARRLVTLDAVGMVNIVAGKKIIPELLQREASPERIASQVLHIMQDDIRYDKMITDLEIVREKLGSGNTAANAVAAIQDLVTLC